MKKLIISLISSGVIISSTSYALPTDHCCNSQGGFYLGVGGSYLLGAGTGPELNIESFQYFDFTSNQFTSILQQVDSDYDWAYEFRVGYDVPCSNNNIELSYFHYQNSNRYDRDLSSAFNTLATYYYTNIITPVFPTPVDGVFTGLTELNGRSSLNYKLNKIDLTVGKRYANVCGLAIHPSLGIRYAHLEREVGGLIPGIVATGIGTPVPIDTLSNFSILQPKAESTYHGIGPVFSLDTRYGFCGFGLVSHLDGALLAGKINSYTIFDLQLPPVAGAGNPLLLYNSTHQIFRVPSTHRVVTSFGGKLGLDYAFTFCNRSSLSVEAGYFVTKYVDTFDIVRGDVQAPLPTSITGLNQNQRITERVTNDFDLNGPYVDVSYHF